MWQWYLYEYYLFLHNMTSLSVSHPTVRFSPNVGAALAQLGFPQAEDVAAAGAVRVFLLLKAQGLTITRSVLWQLDAFARKVPLAQIDAARKSELSAILKQHPPVSLFPPYAQMHAHMQAALAEARLAAEQGEVPVGAVVVRDGVIIARGHNTCLSEGLIARHAELNALTAAAQYIGSYRLDGCDLYVSLEPCAMCAGAIAASRIARLIFAASEAKTGAAGSVLNLFDYPGINHHTAVLGGVCAAESRAVLQAFFTAKR